MKILKDADDFAKQLFDSSLINIDMADYPRSCRLFFLTQWEVLGGAVYFNYGIKKITLRHVSQFYIDTPHQHGRLLTLEDGHKIFKKTQDGEGVYVGALCFGEFCRIEFMA